MSDEVRTVEAHACDECEGVRHEGANIVTTVVRSVIAMSSLFEREDARPWLGQPAQERVPDFRHDTKAVEQQDRRSFALALPFKIAEPPGPEVDLALARSNGGDAAVGIRVRLCSVCIRDVNVADCRANPRWDSQP